MIFFLAILGFIILCVAFWFFLDSQLWQADSGFVITAKVAAVTYVIFAVFIGVIVYLLKLLGY